MRRVLHLLIALSVLLCGLHLVEPAEAAGFLGSEHVAEAPGDCPDSSGEGSDHLVHSSHHHCPVSPPLRDGLAAAGPIGADRLFFVRPAASLTSFAQAPPLEPPAA